MTLRENYNRDGYVVINGHAGIIASTEESFKSAFKRGPEIYMNYLFLISRIIEAQEIFLNIEEIKELISSPVMVSHPSCHVMSPDLRIPGGYYGTEAHQDWASTQGSLDSITVWVALTDVSAQNFPLEVILGSHKQGLREGKLNGSVLEIECDDSEFIPIECNAGDAIILSGFLIHRTGRGTGFRVSISQRFDNAAEPTFIERGYPCAQKRVVDRDIKWKPTVDQVRSIFS